MSPDETNLEHQWPLPPAWMWACARCVTLYRTMRQVGEEIAELRLTGERGVDWDPFDSTLTTQMALGEHLAEHHAELLPAWEPDCDTCTDHRNRIGRETEPDHRRATALRFGNEHLARHIYAPPSTVGFL